MTNDIARLRREIFLLDTCKQRRRYPAALRAKLARLVRARGSPISTLARALGMAPQTLARIAAAEVPTLVPVRVVAETSAAQTMRVLGPRGVVIEGLDVAGVAALLKELA
jgi:transposase-like protein